ncbi:hypothetical protein [Xanthobacter sp.]|uniref:hypothetical protein n=1 Tax=Xanthobacter sp. TaxID=35809 RepID=UPI0025D2D0A5|nr:hypothetical protein [Xanthobacter sp.]
MGTVIVLPRRKPRLVVDNTTRPRTVPSIPAPTPEPAERSRFSSAVALAGLAGASLGWWHGWSTVGALAPIAGALWFAGIVALALGYGATADLGTAADRRRNWRP